MVRSGAARTLSSAIVALASLFVIAYALELTGLLDASIRAAVSLCRRIGRAGLWLLIALAGAASAFLNNTPIVVLGAPVVRDVAKSLGESPKAYLIPLSYAAVLGGCCTLIGTSTNLLVNDMASVAGQPRLGIFEITPVGLIVASAGGLYLFLFSKRLVRSHGTEEDKPGGFAAPAEVQSVPSSRSQAAVSAPMPSRPRMPERPESIAHYSDCGKIVRRLPRLVRAAVHVPPRSRRCFERRARQRNWSEVI